MGKVLGATFYIVLVISQVFAVIMLLLGVWWPAKQLGGLVGSSNEFNLHPFCMVCGFILFYGEATLVYRAFPACSKLSLKITHAILVLIAFVGAVIGLKTAFDHDEKFHRNNVYTMHAWCGIITVLLFSLQYFFGFLAFLWPLAGLPIRHMYMSIHKYFGLAIMFLAAASAISGITEELSLKYSHGNVTYADLPAPAVTGNCLGLFILAFIVTVGYLIYNPEWMRSSDHEDGEHQPLND